MRIAISVVCVLLAFAASLAAVYWLVTQPFVAAHNSAPPDADAAALERHVRALSETFYPRSFDQSDKLDAAAAYIKSEFVHTGSRIEEQVFSVEDAQYRNIVARYGPQTGRFVVIGAHYDSFANPVGGDDPRKGYSRETHTPGADDNASGVAALLELGRLLAQAAPPIGVELVAYSLEEPPHFRSEAMGSAWHARQLRKSGREPVLMLSLEMVGYFSTEPGSQAYPLRALRHIYPDKGDFIAIVGRVQDWSATRRVKRAMLGASDLPVQSINAPPILAGVDFSDHLSYWNQGFSALMITDTAFYRNPHYHSAGDTADRLDYARMAKVVQGIYAVIERFAGIRE